MIKRNQKGNNRLLLKKFLAYTTKDWYIFLVCQGKGQHKHRQAVYTGWTRNGHLGSEEIKITATRFFSLSDWKRLKTLRLSGADEVEGNAIGSSINRWILFGNEFVNICWSLKCTLPLIQPMVIYLKELIGQICEYKYMGIFESVVYNGMKLETLYLSFGRRLVQ